MGNNNSLHQAVLKNDIEFIIKYIKHGHNLDVLDNNGRTALNIATVHNNTYIASNLLIDHGADVNKGRINYMLHHTIINKLYNLSKELIDKKIDLNISDNGYTALHLALINVEDYYKSIEMAEYIIDNGANVNIKDRHGNTPLYYIIKRDNTNTNTKIFKKLIDNGADMYNVTSNITFTNDMSALFLLMNVSKSWLSFQYFDDMCDILINKGFDINRLYENNTTIHYVIHNRPGYDNPICCIEIIEYLIRKGADINKPCSCCNKTPLFLAYIINDYIIFSLLVNGGADINISFNNLTLLQYCIKYNKKDFIKLLVSKDV